MMKQLKGKEDEATEIQLLNLGMLKAKWLVQMADYFADNPQIVVNGFIRADSALDHVSSDREDMLDEDDTENDFGVSDEEQSNSVATVAETEDD